MKIEDIKTQEVLTRKQAMDIRPVIEDLEYLKHVYGDCPAEERVDILKVAALQRIANALEKDQEEDVGGQTLTYHDFFEEFNKKSDYHAQKSTRGGVDIVLDDELKASLLPHSGCWFFAESCFSADELTLMAQLAATPPELRWEINNG